MEHMVIMGAAVPAASGAQSSDTPSGEAPDIQIFLQIQCHMGNLLRNDEKSFFSPSRQSKFMFKK
jgi:hypothetical protein